MYVGFGLQLVKSNKVVENKREMMQIGGARDERRVEKTPHAENT